MGEFRQSCADVVGVSAAYVGAVVGGAFATGREVMHFFAAGQIRPALLASVLPCFAIAGALLMWIVKKNRVASIRDLACLAVGRNAAPFLDIMISIFYLTVLSVVLSAAGALAVHLLRLPRLAGILLLAFAIETVLRFRRIGVTVVNAVLLLLLASTLIITASQLSLVPQTHEITVPASNESAQVEAANWSAVMLYVSYNLLFAAAVFPGWARTRTTAGCIAGATGGGVVLGMLCWAEWRLMKEVFRHVASAEMPVYIALQLVAPAVGRWYPFALASALVTTGVALCFGLTLRLTAQAGANAAFSRRLILCLAVPLAVFDLKTLVGTIYPWAGSLALLLWISIALSCARIAVRGK